MSTAAISLTSTGLEVVDLKSDREFASRRLHVRDAAMQMEGMNRLAQAFLESPDTVLQALVRAAVDLCGAESAGISIQNSDESGVITYHWAATAGKYERFMNAILPSFPSACDLCLQRGHAQLFRVTERFFELMGIQAEVVQDGVLFPWHVDETHGTIWIMSHSRPNAFDPEDARLMGLLANFAAIAYRQQRAQSLLMQHARVTAAAEMANDLAHRINNPLQSLTNQIYLAAQDGSSRALAQQLAIDLEKLSLLVRQLLALPGLPVGEPSRHETASSSLVQ